MPCDSHVIEPLSLIRRFAITALVVALLPAMNVSWAADETEAEPVFSGPQRGEKLPPLSVRNVFSEPPADIEIVGETSDGPLLLVFFHKRTRPAFGLTNALIRSTKANSGDKLKSYVVFLTPDVTETLDWLKRVRGLLPDPKSCGVSTDGAEGPGAYGLNRDVTLTVIVGNKGKATASFALVQPSLETDGNRILKAVAEVTGSREPPDILKFASSQMRPDVRRPAASAGRETQDERLTAMLREAIQRDAKPETVDEVVKRIEEYVAKNEPARNQLGSIAARIVEAKRVENYGIKRVQQAIREWAEAYGPKKPADDLKPADKSAEKAAKAAKSDSKAAPGKD